jgi:ubiquinone biosynthesis protein COQ4
MTVNNGGDAMTASTTAAWSPAPFLVRARRVAGAMLGLHRDPNRLDLVFVLGEAANARVLPRAWAMFEGHPEGRRVLADRPEIDSKHTDLAALARLPDGTLGREYARFLETNRITPDVFKAPEGIDPRAAYLAQRLRQTHDLWHVITGYETDLRGEVLLQAFTFAQTRAPSAFFIAAFGGLRGTLKNPRFFARVARAYRHGEKARRFAPLYWEERWATPVEAIRADLACPRVAA